MKSIRNSLILLSVLPIIVGATSRGPAPFVINSDIYSHFSNEENVETTLEITPRSTGDFKTRLRVYNNLTDALVYTKTYTTSVVAKNTYSLQMVIPTKNRLTEDGLKLEIQYTLNSDTYTTTGVIYPYESKSIAVNRQNLIITNKGVLFKIRSRVIVTDETLDFTDFPEYLSLKSGNAIDFSNLTFGIDKNIGFSCGNIGLLIKDNTKVYPNLVTGSKVTLHCDYIVNESEVTIYLNEQMYVKPDTLEMSKTKLNGMVPTTELFVPVGKEELLTTDDFRLVITNAGYSEATINIPLNFFYSKKVIGQCFDSEYCISGGIRE